MRKFTLCIFPFLAFFLLTVDFFFPKQTHHTLSSKASFGAIDTKNEKREREREKRPTRTRVPFSLQEEEEEEEDAKEREIGIQSK